MMTAAAPATGSALLDFVTSGWLLVGLEAYRLLEKVSLACEEAVSNAPSYLTRMILFDFAPAVLDARITAACMVAFRCRKGNVRHLFCSVSFSCHPVKPVVPSLRLHDVKASPP